MPVKVSSADSQSLDEAHAAHEIASKLAAGSRGLKMRGVIAYIGVGYDLMSLRRALATELGEDVPFIGCTSCLGAGSDKGFVGGPSISALGLAGDDFRMGVAHLDRGGDDEALGVRLAEHALANGGFGAASAGFAVLHCTPGGEERILKGIFKVLKDTTPILGGSAADNDLTGKWGVMSHRGATTNGASLLICDWPWQVATSYESGYMATQSSGVVTDADGRTLRAIDGRPAADVYNEWSRGAISGALADGGPVLAQTTLSPLGVSRARFAGVDCYVLVHPERVLPDRSLSLFADVAVGDKLTLMTSSTVALVHRTSRVGDAALRRGGLTSSDVVGSLLIYCGGCLLAVREEAANIMREYASVVGAPFVSGFTFGEVGCVVPRRIDHGNLMAGVIMLSTKAKT